MSWGLMLTLDVISSCYHFCGIFIQALLDSSSIEALGSDEWVMARETTVS